MDFEDVLKQVGDYGKFQKILVILFLIPTSAINYMYDYMFMLATPDHWCFVPELSNMSLQEQQQFIRPDTIIQGLPAKDNCLMFDVNYTSVAQTFELPYNDTNLIPTKSCTNGWVYDKSVFLETATTKVFTSFYAK